MSTTAGSTTPVAATQHVVIGTLPWDAVRLVMVYIVLLFAIPSNVTITSLGSFGRPAMLWGLVMLIFWALTRLQERTIDAPSPPQPVRLMFVLFLVVALVSFSAAMLRGQPADQISPLITSLFRLLSMGGVLLVIVDGVRTMRDVTRLMRFLAIASALLGVLALLQSLSGQSFLDFWSSTPGFSVGDGGIAERSGRIRPAATATHPLEFGTVLNGALPLCIAGALSRGFSWSREGASSLWWWAAAGVLALVASMSVSRSSIIGLGVAVILMIPAVPPRLRIPVIFGGLVAMAGLIAVVPGLAGSTLSLFTSSDGSTMSRTGALDRLADFVAPSPLVGVGFGMFLPRYYVFDNAWAGLTVELGLFGVAAFAGLVIAAVWSAWNARNGTTSPDIRLSGHALAASTATAAVVFAFFDGLSFPMSAGFITVVMGLCAAVRSVAWAESASLAPMRR